MKRRAVFFILIIFVFLGYIYSDTTFQIEFTSGYLKFNPDDLNLILNFLEKTSEFYIEDHYNYLKEEGTYSSVRIERNDNLYPIKDAIPFSERLRVNFGKHFSVSLGVEYYYKETLSNIDCSSDAITPPLGQGQRQINAGDSERKDVLLSIKTFAPEILFHFITPEIQLGKGSFINFEAYAGPQINFSKIKIKVEGEYSGYIRDLSSGESIEFHEGSFIDMNGSGYGIGVKGGLRLNLYFNNKLGFFISSDYSYGKIKNIKGKGVSILFYEVYENSQKTNGGGDYDTWDAEWYIAEINRNLYWGSFEHELPTSGPEYLNRHSRSFVLYLSGVRVNFGVFIVF